MCVCVCVCVCLSVGLVHCGKTADRMRFGIVWSHRSRDVAGVTGFGNPSTEMGNFQGKCGAPCNHGVCSLGWCVGCVPRNWCIRWGWIHDVQGEGEVLGVFVSWVLLQLYTLNGSGKRICAVL